MGDVYRKTDMVAIWLGSANEYEDTSAAIEGIKIILDNVWPRLGELSTWLRYRWSDDSGIPSSRDIYKDFNLPGPDSPQFTALMKFFLERPWF